MKHHSHPSTTTADTAFALYSDGYAAHFAPCAGTGAQADAQQLSYRVKPALGQGWSDMHVLRDGLLLGRIHCRLTSDLVDAPESFSDSLSLGLMVSGQSAITQGRRDDASSAGDLLIRHADPGPLHRRAVAGRPLGGVSIDVPHALLASMQEQGVPLSHLGRRHSWQVLRPSPATAASLQGLGRRMLAASPAAQGVLARLELESLGLQLLITLLHASCDAHPLAGQGVPRRWHRALDEVLDILHAEWDQPLTIAQLAQRANINQCYLKAFFPRRTGQTIAAYLRQLRMQHARAMLESGQYNVQQVALHCGYSNPSKFSELFRRTHGMAPSALFRLEP